MRNLPACLLLLTLAVHAATGASAFTITITTNGYRGNIRVDNGPPRYVTEELWKLELGPGLHTLDNGTSIAGSFIAFTVEPDGSVSRLKPGEAATPGSTLGSIVFHTVELNVRTRRYAGDYVVSAFKADNRILRGDRKLIVIAGLVYHLDSRAAVEFHLTNKPAPKDSCKIIIAESYASGLRFHIDANGLVKVNNEVAALGGTKGRLYLNTVAFRITQAMIPEGGNVIWCGEQKKPFTKPTKIRIIPGLINSLLRSDRQVPDYFLERSWVSLLPQGDLP
jgi:hypothetical protein